MEKEVWKDVVGWEGQYKVSNLGNVLKCENGDWSNQKANPNNCGYLYIGTGNGKFLGVHNLVCEAFHGPAPSNKHIPDHIDENNTNNKTDNLRWLTNSENIKKAFEINGRKVRAKNKKIVQKTKSGEIVKIHSSLMEAVRFLNKKDHSGVSRACSGGLKTYMGHIWEYAD